MDGIERRREARGGGEGRKLSDRQGGFALLVGEVGDGERDAPGTPVGDPGLVEGKNEAGDGYQDVASGLTIWRACSSVIVKLYIFW